ncbi:hypothetical protein [Stratiformator vulcanicus]|uniref:Double zinc ribbon n=1 Tax=Stratiformator vulcanicus TaxID=2527980 RepID=A0A517R4S2_9PLAN|nr:hypothetical protein [Stratiformator vulcanicus]QDT38886.1 hypothetical protein Pan189_32850 [Stratiformator vulcanicus]
MAIEFRCPSCNKLLRTRDDRAGATASCPDCGSSVTVPDDNAQPEAGPDDFGSDFDTPAETAFAGSVSSPSAPRSPRSPSGRMIDCPMCGASVPAGSSTCHACGEELRPSIAEEDTGGEIDFSECFREGWEKFTSNLGPAVGFTLLSVFAGFCVILPIVAVQIIGLFMAEQNGIPAIVDLAINLGGAVVGILIQTFFVAGLTRFLLLLVRDQEAGIEELFSGGRYYGAAIPNALVFGLATQAAQLLASPFQRENADVEMQLIAGLLSIIGLIVSLVLTCYFWSYMYIIVDDRQPKYEGLGYLKAAAGLSKGSRLIFFALIIVLGAINLAGAVACLLPVLFTMPLTLILMTVAYEQLSNHGRRHAPSATISEADWADSPEDGIR